MSTSSAWRGGIERSASARRRLTASGWVSPLPNNSASSRSSNLSFSLEASEKLRLLDLLEAELLGKGDTQPEAVNLRRALAERSMPPRHALDVLIAFRMDVTKLRYENWDEVIHYCRYSAMPVGRFMLDVHGESTSTWAA